MLIKQKLWDIQEYNSEKAGCLAAELGISSLVTGILLERGFENADAMRSFLYGSKEPFHNPFLMKDMELTVARVEQAMARGEKITVYGDYDVDGITASSLLYIYLKSRGANVATYIPQRKSEGYGLNDEALKNIYEDGTTLVVTVDCGISGLKEVENAPAGMDIIITDHHTVPEKLPAAYAIVNPKQSDCQYPFKELSGVGLAFKLCQALELSAAGDKNTMPVWEDLTELAALGTVADIVPLLDENREIVRRGLKAMPKTKLLGMRALMLASGCKPEQVTSETIGFVLAPRLNAVGRLEHAQRAVELLVTDDPEKAELIANELNQENTLRQNISRQIMEEAEALLAKEKHIDTAIVLASEGWHQGVIGIVASRLVDKYHLPTILMSINDGVAKGSCRSIPALNLYEAIAAESDILLQFGGHHQAAGLTLPADKVDEFRSRFKEYVMAQLKPEDFMPHLTVDCEVSGTKQITTKDLGELSLLEPFGSNNPTPVFAFSNARVFNLRAIGKDRNHLSFALDKGDYSYRGVMWNNADQLPYMFDSMIADVAFMPRINEWQGEVTVQLHARSFKQKLTLGDLRHANVDKWQLLKSYLRVYNSVQLYVADAELEQVRMRLELECPECLDYFKLITYEGLLAEKAEPKGLCLFFSLPEVKVDRLLAKMKSAEIVVLLYNNKDVQCKEEQLRSIYPNRSTMVTAYTEVMTKLRSVEQLSKSLLLATSADKVSENTLTIMQELGFIKVDGDVITKNVIQKCNLEDSPLFVKLQHEFHGFTNIYNDNMRLTQYELLRG